MRNALLGIAALILILILSAAWSLFPTEQISTEKFKGILPLEKPITNIIIVHGIGDHCIGYADSLLLNLFKKIADFEAESIQKSYLRYIAQLSETQKEESKVVRIKGGDEEGYLQSDVYAPRDGHCRVQENGLEGVPVKLNTSDDVASVMAAQDSVCEFINQSARINQGNVRANCHKLYVNRAITKYEDEDPEYATGFVRYVEVGPTASSTLRIYEITWSPATRWIKDSLNSIEQFNQQESAHLLNEFIKQTVMNAGMADAVAYLTNGGVLVNFDILQAFCLVFANGLGEVNDYRFACNNAHLQERQQEFAKENDVILISHSLGTRALFDTIGLLALGVDEEQVPSRQPREDLISAISSSLETIGAVVPQEFLGSHFSDLLEKQIPAFAAALRSVYVFTNQVPLLAANITSPFKPTPDVGRGFARFLELRNRGNEHKLQIVAFHDPDDILSYNLSCWYHVMVLKHLPSTRDTLIKEAKHRAEQTGRRWGDERRSLQDNLFNKTCSKDDLKDPKDKQMWSEILQADQSGVSVIDATMRLKGLRIAGLIANPLAVHSNYFYDEKVHTWLVHGN